MKLDLEYLHKVSNNLHQLYRESGGYNPDEHVYHVQFEPDHKLIRCHISWPYFRNLIANEADGPTEVHKVQEALHLSTRVQGIEMVTCLFKPEVLELLEECPESAQALCEDDDILAMFIVWQNATGWNMHWEVQPNG